HEIVAGRTPGVLFGHIRFRKAMLVEKALFQLMYTGGFGSWFSVQKSLSRAATLLLTALCVAMPARLGLVIIGGEGAVV
ncbi:hypothetical protein ACC795_36630, partial [Rhizobium ruizarguesonis]